MMQMMVKAEGSARKKVMMTSILFMGLGHIIYLKEYLKGIFLCIN